VWFFSWLPFASHPSKGKFALSSYIYFIRTWTYGRGNFPKYR
jgi:hypothetical protein